LQRINYDAIVQNARYFKHILGQTKLCAVLKNNAYGHGAARVASALSGIADFFAVGSLQEAVSVEPFCQNVLILLPLSQKREIQIAASRGFSLTVDSFFTLKAVQNALRDDISAGKKVKIHLALETGMNRLGFSYEQLPQLAREIDCSVVEIEGIFSHFWGESKNSCDKQKQKFMLGYNFLSNNLRATRRPIAHIANTAATLSNDDYHLDMARIGLGIYGYGSERLVSAKKVTASVIAAREVKKGQTIGYGATYIFPRDTRIAIVNVGYANGFSRVLAPAKVKIGQNIFPTVGNICMAMCAADVGNADISVGDEVVLLGDGLNNANSKVIIYELLCNLK